MSVIERQSPLNLIGRVAVVTSAATPLGAQTCRTLLRHNCLVLGIDEVPIPDSERLFSSQGTHFQTLQMTLDENDATTRMVEHIENRFWKQGFDFLITFDGKKGTLNLRKDLGRRIIESEGGVILDVVEGEQADNSVAKNGPRTNVVLTKAFTFSGGESLSLPQGASSEVQECFDRFSKSVTEDSGTAKGNRAFSELLLYLVSSLGKDIDGAVVTANGKWKALQGH